MKNKRIADRLLIILFFLFLVNVLLKSHFQNNFYFKMLSFVVEAALVGSIADWFAITALFERPLGFPWHTAIIPANREKVVDSISNTVESELLSQKVLEDKIAELNIVDGIIEIIESNAENRCYIYKLIDKLLKATDDYIEPGKISSFVERGLKNSLQEIDLSIYLSKIFKFVIKNDECEELFKVILQELIVKAKKNQTKNQIADILTEYIEDNINKQQGIKKALFKIALKIGKGTDTVNISDAAVSIQEQILDILDKLKDKDDPAHIEFMNKVESIIAKLDKDEVLIADIEEWKQEIIKKITIQSQLNEIITNVIDGLKYGIKKEILQQDILLEHDQDEEKLKSYVDIVMPIITWIEKQINIHWEDFKTDKKLKNIIDNYIKEVIYDLIESYHSFIGHIVKKVLNNMTDESLNEFIQLKAGNDLHWIRINGCIVGALFGLIVFIFINTIYLPLFR